jgi:two-component system chemotaxis response regulator CheB
MVNGSPTSPRPQTRVLVVDDSQLMRNVLTTIIESDPQLCVVGTATNGQEAIRRARELNPDLITMDVLMPVMDGLEATKQIMADHPTPILIVSSAVEIRGTELVFQAMKYGALDAMDKSLLHVEDGAQLKQRIKTLARVRVIRHPLARMESRRPVTVRPRAVQVGNDRIVAIAASTGGPQALRAVLKDLPAEIGCGIVIVQHIAGGFDKGLVEWLDRESSLSVRLATDGERIEPGAAYVATTGHHLRVAQANRLRLTDEPPCEGQKPSGTVLFESVAEVYGARAVAVVLSGMGRDGAAGAQRIHNAGGRVIAQDEASCVVFGMPKAAVELGIVDAVRPLDHIARTILAALRAGQVRGGTR